RSLPSSPLAICVMTVTRIASSKETTLPLPPPLRTGRISSPISGSSLSEHSCDRVRLTRRIPGMMHRHVAVRMQEHVVGSRIRAPSQPGELMMVVPSRDGGDRLSTVGTPTTLPLPEGEQEVAPFERGSHLSGEALLEVQFPAGIVGIGPVRDFGMARDGDTVRFEELDGLVLSRWT